MIDNIQRPGLPASLADADPFATHAPPRAVPLAPVQSPPPASQEKATAVPCPCACECGNLTGKTYADVESLNAARNLRCEPCGQALHFGPTWTVQDVPDATPQMGETDRIVNGRNRFRAARGDTATSTFVIRERPPIDPEDEAWEREIARKLAAERRDEARTRWLDQLPERWRLPYDDGEELVPQVEDRLARLASKDGQGHHGTSLICIGPFGSGKTWVAYTYARAAVDRWLLWPQEIRIGTEAEIMEPIALASPWEVAGKSAELLKPTLKLLVVDDVGALGTYKNQDNRYATWTKVVNWMYEHKRALVLTTNKALGERGELEDWIGPTAYERLKHMVGHEQVFRDENKRGELTQLWEAEYQKLMAARTRD